MAHSEHVILGTGPVGCWIAQNLVQQGVAVRAVNRSGTRPDLLPAATDLIAADISDSDAAVSVTAGARVVYQALNPPYHQWSKLFPRLQRNSVLAAGRAGARYVCIENLYPYGQPTRPITEAAPENPTTRKGRLRAAMHRDLMAAHQSGDVRATALRSSDYYGPGVRLSALGERTFGPMIKGGKAELLGSSDRPHSYAYIEDVAAAAVTLGEQEAALGRTWITPHAPAETQGEMAQQAFNQLGRQAKTRVIGARTLRAIGVVNPAVKEMVELMYEFTEPFVVDSTLITETFGLTPTPVADGLRRTLAWYSQQ